jgi:hypothetical protein
VRASSTACRRCASHRSAKAIFSVASGCLPTRTCSDRGATRMVAYPLGNTTSSSGRIKLGKSNAWRLLRASTDNGAVIGFEGAQALRPQRVGSSSACVRKRG